MTTSSQGVTATFEHGGQDYVFKGTPEEVANAIRRVLSEYNCPAWCERPDHDADVVDADNPPIHYGPEFGLLTTAAEGTEPYVDLEGARFSGVVSAAGLRKVATDALAAAEWLEARA